MIIDPSASAQLAAEPSAQPSADASADSPSAASATPAAAERWAWPLWEVFVRSGHGLAHKHVGSLHAADAGMALQNARDVYTRRNEGVSVWIVRSSDIVATDPGERDMLFGPAKEKTFRHPTYFTVPEGIKHL